MFEVDSDWFSDEHKARDTDSRKDIVADARAARPLRADVPGHPIVEIDDEWFAEDEKVREARRAQQRELAAEMGIHDLELPEAEPVPNAPAPADGLDFDFGLDDLVPAPLVPAVTGPPPVAKPEVAPLAPEITDAMLDQIAQRVADRLNSGAFGAQLRDAMTATVCDSVRSVVSDTSERLVRDEIARIKSKTQT
ncbi:MAG: hypothetical protein EXQ50_04285 [Acidobacteria bacterium]|nr:hypothetical protein [Acidobacteriota bacterium]